MEQHERLLALFRFGAWTDAMHKEARSIVSALGSVVDQRIGLVAMVSNIVPRERLVEHCMWLASEELGCRADQRNPQGFALMTVLYWVAMIGTLLDVGKEKWRRLIVRARNKIRAAQRRDPAASAVRLSRVLGDAIGADAAREAAIAEYQRCALPEWAEEVLGWIDARAAEDRMRRLRRRWPWAKYRRLLLPKRGCF